MSSVLINEKSSKHPLVDQGTTYEVFRNNNTAVEVIVKDVHKNGRKRSLDSDDYQQQDIERVQCELDSTKKALAQTKRAFQVIVEEMTKQMENVEARIAETEVTKATLELENEKLKILLESRTKLVRRLKKDMVCLRKELKSVVKSICNAPEVPNFDAGSDTESEEFKSELRSHSQNKPEKMDKSDTFDSTFSLNNSFKNA